MKRILIALTCTWLAACAGPTPQIKEMREEIGAYSRTFESTVASDPSLAPLTTKTSIRVSDLNFDMLVNNQTATEAEKPLIRKVAEAYFVMSRNILDSMRRHEVSAQEYALFDGLYSSAGALGAQIHNGELTWGQYNQKRKDLLIGFNRAHADLVAAVEQRNEEAAYRVASLWQQTFTTLTVQQAAIRAVQPRTTVCNRIGNSVYCN